MSLTIVIISDYGFEYGGASKVAIISAKGLKKRGYNVIFFTGVGPVDPELNSTKIKVICTNQSDILNNKNRLTASVNGIWNFNAQKELFRILKKLDNKKTVIHVHSVVKALSPSIYQVIFNRGFKVICTLHDYFLACPNGSFYNYGDNRICKLTPLSSKCVKKRCDPRKHSHKLWRLLRTFIQKKHYKIPGRIINYISLSDLSEEVLRKYLPSNARIFRINNPIDIEKNTPVKITDDSYFAFVGRVSREKGVELLARISHRIKKKILFVGDGPSRIHIEKLNPGLKITGWLEKQKVSQLLKKARTVIYPSLWYEVQPLVILESAAIGLPVIVPDTSASREFVKNEITGLWFRGGNEEDLLCKIRLLENTSYARELGLTAYRDFWASPFSIDTHIDNLEMIYQEILYSSL